MPAQKLIDIAPGELMLTSIALETENEETPVWASGENVYPDNGGISRYIGAELIGSVSQTIQHITQHFPSKPQAIMFGDTAAWKYLDGNISLIGSTFLTPQSVVTAETWGNWIIANNNKEKTKVWKNTAGFTDLAGTNFPYCIEMIRRQPYILALGTIDPVTVSWCHTGDPEQWTPLPANAAGDFTIRDIPGAIVGGCPLGENTAIYSRESITLATYVGPPYYFSFNTTLSGVGLYGPRSVCAVDRRNYGIGPQGPFVTDGYSFQLIGSDNLRRWIAKHLDTTRPDKVIAFHNELLESVEFRFMAKDGTRKGLIYKLGTELLFPLGLQLDAASERDVFDTAFVAIGNKFCKLKRSPTWGGEQVLGRIGTKFSDAGLESMDKLWDTIRVDGTLAGLNMELNVQTYDPNTQAEVVEQIFNAQVQRQNYPLREALKIQAKFEGTSDWHLSRIQVYGEPTGLTI